MCAQKIFIAVVYEHSYPLWGVKLKFRPTRCALLIHCVQLYCCTGQNLIYSRTCLMMIMRIIIPTPRLSLYPCESQTCPVGCEYAVSTIGVLEVISRLIEPWHYHLPLPMDFSSQSVSSTCQRLLFALTLQSSIRASLLCRIAMLQKLKARYGF